MEQKKKRSELEANISLGAAIFSVLVITILIIMAIVGRSGSVNFEWAWTILYVPLSLWPWASLTAIVSGVIGMKNGQSKKKTGLGIAGGALSLALSVLLVFIVMNGIASAFGV